MSTDERLTTEERLRHYLKRMAMELRQARQRLADREAEDAEPIAIIGMGCRLPGGVSNAEQLWRLVATGTDAISAFPTDRGWDTDRLHDPSGDRSGTTHTREGGFLYGAAEFDAGFFGIAPREALGMDPQQRLLLETSWEALEDARIDPTRLRGSRTGVFVGAATQGYGFTVDTGGVGVEGYGISGVSTSLISGRIAYTLGLEGAAVTIDSACSSSLVALHLACQSLRRGETDLALTGGVTVMATPSTFVEFSRQGGLAEDGRCRSFSADADGTGWAEGVGVLVVERLSDARRNGHDVLALVRGSAVNQDGASNGLTAPNGPAQQRVILAALADAGLTPREVDVVEGHGTGTRLGDPIEVQAVMAVYGMGRDPAEPLWLGSLKSNLGHAQSAAGVAAVIKMVEAMRHGTLPRTLHADTPSEDVDWAAGTVRLLTESRRWSCDDHPRRAGVSAFGIGGTNAHIILEQDAPAAPGRRPEQDGGGAAGDPSAAAACQHSNLPQHATATVPLVLSGASPDAVRGQAAALRAHLLAHPEQELADVARSLATTRSLFDHRAAVVASDRARLIDELARVVPVASGRGLAGALFSGQGAQRTGMGRELAESFPVFAEALRDTCAVTDPLLGRSLRDVMWREPATTLARTEFAQPALFAFELALARLWASWGVRFAGLVGHSIGEITAAVVAGALSARDGASLAVARGRLMQALPPGGAMVAVDATETEVSLLLEGESRVVIAAVNGPSAVVVSGEASAVARIGDYWRERGRRTRRLSVGHAFHSPLMEPMLAEFATVVATMECRPPAVPVSPTADTAEPFATPAYWVEHARRAVRFAAAIQRMPDVDVLIELGPDAALAPMIDIGTPVLASSRRDRSETEIALSALAWAHAHGVPVDVPAVLGEGATVPLPTYAFQRDTYWLVGGTSAAARPASDDERFWAAVARADAAELTGALAAPAELLPVLPALAGWHDAVRHRQAADAWRYRVGWRPVIDPATAAQVPGTWLVVSPAGSADTVARRSRVLTRLLADVVIAETGADRGATATALRAAIVDAPPLAGVVSLLDSPESALALVQALGDARVDARLWCLTQRAVAVGRGEATADTAAAAVWGLGRVVSLEHPSRWGGLVDLPDPIDERASGWLAGILTGDGQEDQTAIRPSGVWARRLEPAPAGPVERAWTARGTILITGGTGSLGARVARWLACHGAGSLVLVSRRGPAAPGVADLVTDLERAGAKVRVRAVDVRDAARMAAVARELAGSGEPVRSVFHTAGIGQDTPLGEMSAAQFDAVYSVKARGAQVLDEVFAATELDAFVLFSSISGVWGSGHQGAYAAGNAYLDALAERRRARGSTATAIAWGVWSGSSMVDPAGERRLRRRGLVPMRPDDAIRMLHDALDRDEATITVAHVDWRSFLVGYTAARPRPLVADLPQVEAIATATGAGRAGDGGHTGRTVAGRTVAELAGAERVAALRDMVRRTAAEALGHADPAEVPEDRPFVELGIDSLSAVEIRNRLGLALGLALPAMLVFDHPTVRSVAEFLAHALDERGYQRAPAPDGQPGESAESFAAIYRSVALRGRMTEVEALLTGAAGVRSRFGDPAAADTGFVRLATGAEGPAVICFPPFAPVEQSLQFARLAMFFRERRDLSMVNVPGFQPESALAATIDVLVEVLVTQTLRCAAGAPFALLGYSSSGWLAHAVATALETAGTRPSGLVLLDTYLPDNMPLSLRQAMNYEVNERRARFTTMNLTTLTALGTYRAMFRPWSPTPTSVPTLFVAPESRVLGDPAGPAVADDWEARWPLPHTRIRVPGDHCTMVAEHAAETAAAVHDWLRAG